MNGFERVLNPEVFQGGKHKKRYFEGWYYKCVDESIKNIIAFIPGISRGPTEKDSHAFIQVIDGSRNRSGYFTFPMKDFTYAEDRLELSIGKNTFSKQGLAVALADKKMSYFGKLFFERPQPYPKSFFHPGIMGPFSFIPFLECYHGVVHIQHELTGSLTIDREPQSFTNGLGYIEKDWGTSFPDAWVWIQCNHFDKPNVSFMLSYAHIPFIGRSFSGLIAFLSIEGKLYRLTTYQGAHVTSLDYQRGILHVLAESKKYALNINVTIETGSLLKAPKMGGMATNITESMTSSLNLLLLEKSGRILYEGKGQATGIEMVGDLTKLD